MHDHIFSWEIKVAIATDLSLSADHALIWHPQPFVCFIPFSPYTRLVYPPTRRLARLKCQPSVFWTAANCGKWNPSCFCTAASCPTTSCCSIYIYSSNVIIVRPCLDPNFFWFWHCITFVFIWQTLSDHRATRLKDSSRDLKVNCTISYLFYLYLMFHVCAARFDVTRNLIKFWVFGCI